MNKKAGKNVYWHENSRKFLGSAVLQGDYIILTAQDKNRKSNMTTTSILSDFGISPYSFFRIIPDDVTDFTIIRSLKIITNIAVSGFLIDCAGNAAEKLPVYYEIIDESLSELDKLRVNTARIRIIYMYLKNINKLKLNFEDTDVFRFFLWELYNDLLSFYSNISDYAVTDLLLVKYCLNNCLKEGCEFVNAEAKKRIVSCLNTIDGLLLSDNYKKYFSKVKKMHDNLENLKKLNDDFLIKNISFKL